MKKLILLLTFLTCFTSCKKYAEGPSFTLLTKKSRVANNWKLKKYFIDGADKTGDALVAFKDFNLIIDKNNMKYSKSFTALSILPYGEAGSWKFSSDKMNIEFTPDNSNIKPYSWKIEKLKEKEVCFSYTDNNTVIKAYLIPK